MFKKKSQFVKMFGGYPLILVLDFLMEDYLFDFNQAEIARSAGISVNTLKLFFDKLVKEGLVVKTRKVGKSQMYKINLDNEVVKLLMQIRKMLRLKFLEKEERVKVPVKA